MESKSDAGSNGSEQCSRSELTLETLPEVVLDKLLSFLDFTSISSLQKTSHRISDIVAEYFRKLCLKLNLTEDPTPLCVPWKVNAKSRYSFDNAVDVCENSIKKWQILAARNHLKSGFKCVICGEFLRDICGLNGAYFEHDLLLCYAVCYQMFTLSIRGDVVGGEVEVTMATVESNGQNFGFVHDEVTDDVICPDKDYEAFSDTSCYHPAAPMNKLDSLPRHILNKILSFLGISDLIAVEQVNRRLWSNVSLYWKSYCYRFDLKGDPTPLCVGWGLNDISLFSYDRAVALCEHPVKKWRLLAVRCFLRNCYRCIICRQHLKDRNSVDGFYFAHDVLLCYPQCYEIFTINFQLEMLKICENYGITLQKLKLIDSTFPIILVAQFIKTLRNANIDEKEVLAELRPFLGYSTEAVREYYEYTLHIKDHTNDLGLQR